MPEFHETIMGHRFFEGQLPQLIKILESIAVELKRQNDLAANPAPYAVVHSCGCERIHVLSGSDAQKDAEYERLKTTTCGDYNCR